MSASSRFRIVSDGVSAESVMPGSVTQNLPLPEAANTTRRGLKQPREASQEDDSVAKKRPRVSQKAPVTPTPPANLPGLQWNFPATTPPANFLPPGDVWADTRVGFTSFLEELDTILSQHYPRDAQYTGDVTKLQAAYVDNLEKLKTAMKMGDSLTGLLVEFVDVFQRQYRDIKTRVYDNTTDAAKFNAFRHAFFDNNDQASVSDYRAYYTILGKRLADVKANDPKQRDIEQLVESGLLAKAYLVFKIFAKIQLEVANSMKVIAEQTRQLLLMACSKTIIKALTASLRPLDFTHDEASQSCSTQLCPTKGLHEPSSHMCGRLYGPTKVCLKCWLGVEMKSVDKASAREALVFLMDYLPEDLNPLGDDKIAEVMEQVDNAFFFPPI